MQIVKLNLIPGGVLPVCFASQHDTGRVIRFMLFEGENVFTLSGAESIALRLQKPDGSELVESVTNTGADYVDVVTTADTCDTAGASVGEIVITDGGDVLGSANFGLFVESDAFEGGGIVTQTASGPIATFETNIETAFVSLKSDINPVQSGTGTPSPQNVRPISGFSALNVTRTGKNLLNATGTNTYTTLVDGVYTVTSVPQTGYSWYIGWVDLKAGTYILSGGINFYCRCYLKAGNEYYTSQGADVSFTLTSDTTVSVSGVITPEVTVGYKLKPMIRKTGESADFEPYNGQTATVNFGQTVYGGVADVTNGKVNVTHAIVDLGTLDWVSEESALSGLARVNQTQVIPLGAKHLQTPICTQFEGVYTKSYANFNNGEIAFSNSGQLPFIRARLTEFIGKTNAQIKALMSGVMLCYELATPIEITTTPENLTAIVGQNNVYGDTNGDTTVEYYIEV